MEQQKNGLGIASFVLGIMGFLTGFIVIGIFFDIIAIALGIIAIASKKQKSGMGVAGMIIGVVSIALMFFVGSFFNSLSKDNVEVSNKEINGSEESVTENENDSINDELSEKDIDVTEYSYENTIGSTLHFLIIKNNSTKTISVNANTTALDVNGEIIGAADTSLEALGVGEESFLIGYFDNVKGVDKFEYILDVKEDIYYDSVLSDLSHDLSKQEDKVIISCTNNADQPAKFVQAMAIFFKNGEVVNYSTGYLTDDNSELKPGKTLSVQLDCYKGYDDVKVYLSGHK